MDAVSFAQLSIVDISLVALAAFAAAFVSGIGGFGGSFILAIALAPVVGPKALVPLIAVYALAQNLGRLYIFRQAIRWPMALEFVLASLPGVAIGALFLKWVPENGLLALFGLVLLSALPMRRWLKHAEFKPGWRTIAVIGVVFGAVSGTAVGSGMLVIAALNTFGLHGFVLLGTDAAIGIANAFSRVLTFWWLGLLDVGLVIAGMVTGLVSMPATWLANLVVKRIGTSMHAAIIETIIVGAGLSFLTAAFWPSP